MDRKSCTLLGMLASLLWLLFLQPTSATEPWHPYDLKTQPKVRVEGTEKAVEESKPAELDPAIDPLERTLDKASPGRIMRRRKRTARPAMSKMNWGGEVGYSLRTDLADEVDPRLYSHALSVSYGFQHVPTKITLAAILEAAYESTSGGDREILVDSDKAELFVNNFTLAVQKDLRGPYDTRFDVSLANEFPTSPEARREEFGSVTWLSLGGRAALIPERLTMSLRGEVFYIWNKYKYSPASGDTNQLGGARAEAGLRLSVWRGLYLSGSVGSQLARYTDNTSDASYRNAASLGYIWPRLSLSMTASNGTYLDREDSTIWFVDEYRRMLSASARISF